MDPPSMCLLSSATAAAAGADDGGPWDELWGRLCHQGLECTSASYAALPTLAQMSAQHDPSGYVAALHLAASIIASNDGPEEKAIVRQRYAHELADLRTVATRNLRHATGDTDFVYGLQALMAFEDGGIWQRTLDCLANGEASLECPSCGEDLLLNLDSPDAPGGQLCRRLARTHGGHATPSLPHRRLKADCSRSHRPTTELPSPPSCLISSSGSNCPRCHASFQVPQAFACDRPGPVPRSALRLSPHQLADGCRASRCSCPPRLRWDSF